MRISLVTIVFAASLLNSVLADTEKLFQWQASESLQLSAPLAKKIPSNEYVTLNGMLKLSDVVKDKPFIIAVRDPDCPVSRRYAPYLKDLQSKNIDIIYLLTGSLATPDIARRDKENYGLDGVYILDSDRKLSEWLGVRTSSEVYLFDENTKLRYRGAIDDRFGIGFSRTKATKKFLVNALNSVRAGLAVDIPMTSSPGCYVNQPVIKEVANHVTWHKHVNRLMTEKCKVCHRVGQAGPFPLQTYEQVIQRKSMIRFVLNNKIMPPWFASGDADQWVGGRHLASVDRQMLIDWIDSGAPEGDIKDAATSHKWFDGWQLGEPDIVLTSPRVLDIPAEGEIAYEYVSIPTDFESDRWVEAIEVSTDVPQNTHHIILFVLPPDSGPIQEKILPGIAAKTTLSRREMHLLTLRGFYGGYVQGLPGVRYQRGVAKLLPKGWRLLMQIHYEANGIAKVDQPRIGIQFSQKTPEKIVETLAAATKKLTIPPGAAKHKEMAGHTFRESGQIYGFFPHTHLRGKAFSYTLKEPDGTEKVLLDVPRYNPNWQYYYQLKSPIHVQAGSTLIASATYDNSKNNPNNPDPTAEVNFGLRTRDEMMIGYFDWVQSP
ncbi:MAG: hypothetical protein AB8C40_04725 [Gammaproteobacteria bacterium]